MRFIRNLNQNLIKDNAWNWFVTINSTTLAVNFADKMSALCGFCYRVPEMILHLLSLLGGAPATALSMIVFNHKSSKMSYHEEFNACCNFHICGLIVVVGARYLFL